MFQKVFETVHRWNVVCLCLSQPQTQVSARVARCQRMSKMHDSFSIIIKSCIYIYISYIYIYTFSYFFIHRQTLFILFSKKCHSSTRARQLQPSRKTRSKQVKVQGAETKWRQIEDTWKMMKNSWKCMEMHGKHWNGLQINFCCPHASGKDHGMPQKQSLHHRPSFSIISNQQPGNRRQKHGAMSGPFKWLM